MKNKLEDLNNHLFEQLERLNDEDLTGEALEEELKRSRAVASISSQIIENGRLVLDALKHQSEFALSNKEMPKLLGGSDGKSLHSRD